MLGCGSITYFTSPTLCAVMMSSYLTFLSADFMKSMYVMKKGGEPWWSVKVKDIGYVTACGFLMLTTLTLARAGIARFRTNMTKSLVVAETKEGPKEKEN